MQTGPDNQALALLDFASGLMIDDIQKAKQAFKIPESAIYDHHAIEAIIENAYKKNKDRFLSAINSATKINTTTA